MDARPTAMGPPPTSHFHILADTPAGLAPVNPPKTPQPSAARTMLDLEDKTRLVGGKTEEGAEGKTVGPDFGLKTDIYDKRNAALKRLDIVSQDWFDQLNLHLHNSGRMQPQQVGIGPSRKLCSCWRLLRCTRMIGTRCFLYIQHQ